MKNNFNNKCIVKMRALIISSKWIKERFTEEVMFGFSLGEKFFYR